MTKFGDYTTDITYDIDVFYIYKFKPSDLL
jgi:hypothetical protein